MKGGKREKMIEKEMEKREAWPQEISSTDNEFAYYAIAFHVECAKEV